MIKKNLTVRVKKISNVQYRKELFNKFAKTTKFNNKIVILGLGAIGTVLLHTIDRFIDIDRKNIIVVDKNNKTFDKIKTFDIHKEPVEIVKDNIEKVFIDKLQMKENDILLDCSYEIDTLDLFKFCNKFGISYINSAVEDWSDRIAPSQEYDTYYDRISTIEEFNQNLSNKNTNFIIGLGCNPGNVNIWVLYALEKINKKFYQINEPKHNLLAQKMGLNTIHISERDSHITNKPKRINEYVNTWAGNGNSWYDEALSYVEVSWGTHEKEYPPNILPDKSNDYQIVINKNGCNFFARTFVPSSDYLLGMVIRHEECYTIPKYLSVFDKDNKKIYQPSCYYVYNPNDSSKASIYEVIEDEEIYQDYKRLMTSDITQGKDEVGATLFFQDGKVFWIGSILDINEARFIFNNELNEFINSTILQVVAGYIGGLIYIIKLINHNKKLGLILPEHLPVHDFVHSIKPFIGIFGIFKVDWTSDSSDNKWQFKEFIEEF
jgi:homospermidine synthase